MNKKHYFQKIITTQLCDYGCWQKAEYKLNNNKLCCSKYYAQCPSLRQKNTQSNKGKKHSEETKNKIRLSHIGKSLSEETKRKISENHADFSGYKHPMFSKKHSEETKRKISISNKGKIASKSLRKQRSINAQGENNSMFGVSRCGPDNPNWKGGLSTSPYCSIFLLQDFRKMIFTRDGYKCLNPLCNKQSKRLVLHHIDYIKTNCETKNIITLCNSCNAKANADREWHISWYKAIIYQRYRKEK